MYILTYGSEGITRDINGWVEAWDMITLDRLMKKNKVTLAVIKRISHDEELSRIVNHPHKQTFELTDWDGHLYVRTCPGLEFKRETNTKENASFKDLGDTLFFATSEELATKFCTSGMSKIYEMTNEKQHWQLANHQWMIEVDVEQAYAVGLEFTKAVHEGGFTQRDICLHHA